MSGIKPKRMFRVFSCDWGDGPERGPQARGTLTLCVREDGSEKVIYVVDATGSRREFDCAKLTVGTKTEDQRFTVECLLHGPHPGPDRYVFNAYKEIPVTGDNVRMMLVRAVNAPGAVVGGGS